jgi:ATP synthase protein I
MVDDQLRDLGKRVQAVRARRATELRGSGGASRGQASGGMAIGLRIVIEMVAALAVGVGGGLFLDAEFGSSPWCLIVGFILGSGGAFANVLRTARDLDARQKREREAAIASERADGLDEG